MSQTVAQYEKSSSKDKLARRDWVLLPLLSLLTICLLVGGTEWLSRRVFPQSRTDIYTCLAGNRTADGVLNGLHGIPDAACEGNNRDTPITSYHLNALGHRQDAPIPPRSPGVFRIVMLGSSVAFGEAVPLDRTFAKILPDELSSATGRRVELYNAGMFGEVPDVIAQHFEEVLPLKPDLILWVLTAHDLKDTTSAKEIPAHTKRQLSDASIANRGSFASRIWRSARVTFAHQSLAEGVADLWQHGVDHIYGTSSAVVLLQHVLYQNETQYLRSYLESGDATFLRKPLGADWQDHLEQFGIDDAKVEVAARKAHIPVLTVLLPNAAQAVMISTSSSPEGFDPYLLDRSLRSVVVSHGGGYLEILPLLDDLAKPEQYFFQVNGHPNIEGHTLMAKMLSRALLSGSVAIGFSAKQPRKDVR